MQRYCTTHTFLLHIKRNSNTRGTATPKCTLPQRLILYTIVVSNLNKPPFSIKPPYPCPKISFGTSNGTNHFGLVRPEYSGPALKATLTSLVISVGRTEISLCICLNCFLQYRSFVFCMPSRTTSSFQRKVKCCE